MRVALAMLHLSRLCGVRAYTLVKNSTCLHKQIATQQRKPFSSLWQKFVEQEQSTLLQNAKTTAKTVAKASSKPTDKKVGYWLLGCSGMVFVAVVLGGVTRLTESGLSMVTWKLLGEKMPRTEEQWVAEFEKYKQFPEYKIKNHDITLSEFKHIWHMEYGHRMWGRLIGAAFFLPATYFWMRGHFKPALKNRIMVFGGLLAAQGLMGWYMVKSGLEDRFQGASDVPRVSQYRLAAHLALALALYAGLFRSALHILWPAEAIPTKDKAIINAFKKFRMFAHSTKGLVFFTAVSGAFVAGLDAGLVYNSFPKMGDKWVPEDAFAMSPRISNFTENPTTVQLDHRILGITSLTLISALWLVSRKRMLPPRARKAVNAYVAMAWLQVALGITTLLTYVPVSIASLHQSGSLILFTKALWLTHEMKRLPK